jgi:hypothetical protein
MTTWRATAALWTLGALPTRPRPDAHELPTYRSSASRTGWPRQSSATTRRTSASAPATTRCSARPRRRRQHRLHRPRHLGATVDHRASEARSPARHRVRRPGLHAGARPARHLADLTLPLILDRPNLRSRSVPTNTETAHHRAQPPRRGLPVDPTPRHPHRHGDHTSGSTTTSAAAGRSWSTSTLTNNSRCRARLRAFVQSLTGLARHAAHLRAGELPRH